MSIDFQALVNEHGNSFSLYTDDADKWNSPSVYVYRSYSGAWTVKISHSSSSSSTEGTKSILAAALMITNLQRCIDIAQECLARVDDMEAAYTAYHEAQRAEHEARRAAEQAVIDADTQLTSREVAHLVATMAVDIKHGGKYKVAKRLRVRGSTERFARLVARQTEGGAVQFKLNGTVMPKSKLDALLVKYAAIVDAESIA